MNNNKFTIALLQLQMTADGDFNENNAAEWVKKAAEQGAQIVCLPELYRSQYFCQKEDVNLFDLAEPFPGPSTERFSQLAKELGVAIVLPFFEHRGPGVYHNSAAIIENNGEILGLYRKMHIPDDPAYYEKFYFAPGDLGFKAFETKAGKIGTLICWDQWYPEGARLTALQGAMVLFYPTAIGWHPYEKEEYGTRQRDAWITVQRGHAVANGVYVAAANRVGHEQTIPGAPGIEFWGSSFIADPQGVIIAQASTDKEEILLAEIDPAHLENIRRNWPFFRDRRIDAYGVITKRFID